MCGRYYIDDGETIEEMRKILDEIDAHYQNKPLGPKMKTGEIFPTDVAPVLIAEESSVQPVLMTWGYPKWQGTGTVINARAETADEKPMFRNSIIHRRCIIPSTGFFEWDHSGATAKSKFLVKRKESAMLYMAGLFSIFADKGGNRFAAYVILTVNANASVRAIHDRMPLVIEPGLNERWLHDEQYARAIMTAPCPAVLDAVLI